MLVKGVTIRDRIVIRTLVHRIRNFTHTKGRNKIRFEIESIGTSNNMINNSTIFYENFQS